jgi:hypothetical protein
VSARTVDLESLSPFVIVLIPDAVMMSDAEISVIEQYVRDGGSVICTGMTSLVDDRGRRRPDFGLRNLLKVRFESTLNYKISYITHINDVLSAGIDTRDPIIFRGMQAKVVPDADAEVGAIIGYPASEIALPRTITYASDVSFEGESDFPAAVLTEVGKGRCVYFAGEMTKNYGVYGYPNLRLLLENAIQWCCRQHLPIELEAPLNVETNLFRQGDRYLIHLLNYTTDGMLRVVYDRGGPFGTASVPCGRITVRLRLNGKKPKNVYIASSKQELKHDAKEGMLGIEVPGLDTYEIVVVEC